MNKKFMREAIRLSIQQMRAITVGRSGQSWCGAARLWDAAGTRSRQRTTPLPTPRSALFEMPVAGSELSSSPIVNCTPVANLVRCASAAIYWASLRSVCYGNTRKDAARIEFNDDFIYREVNAPISRRKSPMKQLLRKEALAAFEEWKVKPGKIRY